MMTKVVSSDRRQMASLSLCSADKLKKDHILHFQEIND